jgi:hypothetical protein
VYYLLSIFSFEINEIKDFINTIHITKCVDEAHQQAIVLDPVLVSIDFVAFKDVFCSESLQEFQASDASTEALLEDSKKLISAVSDSSIHVC